MYKKISLTVLICGLICVCVQGNAIDLGQATCPENCPTVYEPLCATNGTSFIVFGNDCMLARVNCHPNQTGYEAYSKAHMDWCRTDLIENLDSIIGNLDLEKTECLRACPFIYQPICASNGKYRATIPNKCMLDVFNCALRFDATQTLFTVLKEGSCKRQSSI